MMALAYMQVALGVATLVNHVPTWLAACHQNGSMALLTAIFWLTNELRRVPK
jgi:cytochrome c oxidase assembly protein subunit 15